MIVLAGAVIVDQPSLAGGPLYGPLSADTPFIAEGQSADGLWLWVRLPEGGAGWAMGMQSSGETGGLPVVDASGQAVGNAGDGAATAFYFTSGMGDAPCPLAPASGLLIQSPQDAGEVHLRLDGVDVSLASTASTSRPRRMASGCFTCWKGRPRSARRASFHIVPAGWRTQVPLDADGAPSGPPSAPEASIWPRCKPCP